MYFSPCVAPHLNPLSLHLYCEFLIFLRACPHLFSHAQSYPTLCVPVDCSLPGFYGHGIFQARITKAGCYFLLQGIFLTQGSKPCFLCLLHWQVDSLPLKNHGLFRLLSSVPTPWSYSMNIYSLKWAELQTFPSLLFVLLSASLQENPSPLLSLPKVNLACCSRFYSWWCYRHPDRKVLIMLYKFISPNIRKIYILPIQRK